MLDTTWVWVVRVLWSVVLGFGLFLGLLVGLRVRGFEIVWCWLMFEGVWVGIVVAACFLGFGVNRLRSVFSCGFMQYILCLV